MNSLMLHASQNNVEQIEKRSQICAFLLGHMNFRCGTAAPDLYEAGNAKFRPHQLLYSPELRLSSDLHQYTSFPSTMGDPLSIIGSVVGIVAAGTELAIILYKHCDTAKNAPRSIREVASNLSLLSTILENIGEVLERHKDVYRERLWKETEGLLEKYKVVQNDVKDLIKRQRGFRARVKWVFVSEKMEELLVKIEGLKSAMNLVLGLINLAVVLKDPGKDVQK
jgi:hypothetical protein